MTTTDADFLDQAKDFANRGVARAEWVIAFALLDIAESLRALNYPQRYIVNALDVEDFQ